MIDAAKSKSLKRRLGKFKTKYSFAEQLFVFLRKKTLAEKVFENFVRNFVINIFPAVFSR